jgi:hypothetical protein
MSIEQYNKENVPESTPESVTHIREEGTPMAWKIGRSRPRGWNGAGERN